MIRSGSLRVAIRVGIFAALGAVVAETINGHVADRTALAVFAVEVWAMTSVAWLLVEAVRGRR